VVATVRVDVPEPATDVGLNVAVAPDINPLTLKLTFPANPLSPVTVTVYVALDPRVTVWEVGDAEIEKLGAGFTVKLTVVECFSPPLVPLMVTVNVPVLAVLLVVTVMVLDPEPVTELGLNFALAPEPRPLALKLTLELNPLSGVTVTV
jgi:hypothetical protein